MTERFILGSLLLLVVMGISPIMVYFAKLWWMTMQMMLGV